MSTFADGTRVVGGRSIGRSLAAHPVVWTWLLVSVLFAACWAFGVSPNGDFDDVLKLEKVRWFLETGIWFDQSVPGILQPEPFHSHWPRLLDLPYAAIAWMLEPFVGSERGLNIAAFAVPLLLLLPALALYRRLIATLGFQRPDVVFALATLLALRTFFEFEPGRIDYHNVQILSLLGALALLHARGYVAALANGGLAALAMATSIEFAPFYALVAGVYAVEFIKGGSAGWRRSAMFGMGLAIAALVAYPVIVAAADYASARCDMYSSPHLLTLVCGGLAMAGSSVLGRASRPAHRALLLAVPGVSALVVIGLLFPECLSGPYAGLSAYLRDNWLTQIPQERSLAERPDFVFSQSMLSAAIQFVGATGLAVIALSERARNRNLTVSALFALLALFLGILYFRNIRYLPIFAGPGIVLVLAGFLPRFRAVDSPLALRPGRGLPTPMALLAPGLAVTCVLVAATIALSRSDGAVPAATLAGSCDAGNVQSYRWPAAARIMAPPDLGIRLLAGLPPGAAVIAVPYHTAAAGVQRAYRFLDPASSDPRAILTESAATHVLVCAWPGLPSPAAEAQYPFAAALMEGKPPPWLLECPTDADGPLRIYRYPAAGPLAAACPSAHNRI